MYVVVLSIHLMRIVHILVLYASLLFSIYTNPCPAFCIRGVARCLVSANVPNCSIRDFSRAIAACGMLIVDARSNPVEQ
jgi:hypothetical protein